MGEQLHLLRGFTGWEPDGKPITKIEDAAEWVEHIAGLGFDRFYTWTTRRVTRAEELKNGSVFFCKGGRTLFRMPFVQVDEDGDGWAIMMRPKLIPVLQKRVGMVRGWRYMKDADAPKDMPFFMRGADAIDMPPDMQAELRKEGLL